jgi:hypothetical protein
MLVMVFLFSIADPLKYRHKRFVFVMQTITLPLFQHSASNSVGAPLSLQRGNLIGLANRNNAHLLVALFLGKTDIRYTVHVTDAVDFEKLVRDIHQVSIDYRLRCLGAFLGEFLIDAHDSGRLFRAS